MFKFIAGVLVGLLIAAVIVLAFLPAAPSNKLSRYPIAKSRLPVEAVEGLKSGTLGLDIYWHTMGPPDLTMDMPIPLEKSTSYRLSTRNDGTFVVRDSAWAEYKGKLYPVFTHEKVFKKDYTKYFKVHKVWKIDANRMLTVQVHVPELNVEETFGPFNLFSAKINYSSQKN